MVNIRSHYSQGFIHPRWCRISSINRIRTYHLYTSLKHIMLYISCLKEPLKLAHLQDPHRSIIFCIYIYINKLSMNPMGALPPIMAWQPVENGFQATMAQCLQKPRFLGVLLQWNLLLFPSFPVNRRTFSCWEVAFSLQISNLATYHKICPKQKKQQAAETDPFVSCFHCYPPRSSLGNTLPETNIFPENRAPLEIRRFRTWKPIIFRGENVSFRECNFPQQQFSSALRGPQHPTKCAVTARFFKYLADGCSEGDDFSKSLPQKILGIHNVPKKPLKKIHKNTCSCMSPSTCFMKQNLPSIFESLFRLVRK